MTYYQDMTKYTYHNSYCYREGTKNVGWLGVGHEFETWSPTELILDRLWGRCKISIAQMRGVHECEFCGSDEAFLAERNGEILLLGTSEIRVFSKDGEIYAAPTLIYHYVSAHYYKPPDQFIRALLESPSPLLDEYFDRLQELGLEWNPTGVPGPDTKRRSLGSPPK
jgi:hypothetical protein